MKNILIELAEKLKLEKKDKSKSLKTLQDANILDENGEYTEQYSNLNKTEFMTKDQKTYVDNIINDLLSMEVDGETMEYIIRGVNLENQILWQLMMNASDSEIYYLIDVRRSFYDSNNDGPRQ